MNEQIAPADNSNISWLFSRLSGLTPLQVFELARLRQSVFIVEQSCCYQDLDDFDTLATHILGLDADGSLIACARIIAIPGSIRIGRVVVAKNHREAGLGHRIMVKAIEHIRADISKSDEILLSAQSHLIKFYSGHGFKPVGCAYHEDGIPHQDMIFKDIFGESYHD